MDNKIENNLYEWKKILCSTPAYILSFNVCCEKIYHVLQQNWPHWQFIPVLERNKVELERIYNIKRKEYNILLRMRNSGEKLSQKIAKKERFLTEVSIQSIVLKIITTEFSYS